MTTDNDHNNPDPDATQERYEGDTQERSWDANVKRTYDEYQDISLASARRSQTHFDKVITDAQQHDNTRQTIANEALQNAVTASDLATKGAINAQAISYDRMWNIDEQSAVAAGLIAAVVKAIQDGTLEVPKSS